MASLRITKSIIRKLQKDITKKYNIAQVADAVPDGGELEPDRSGKHSQSRIQALF